METRGKNMEIVSLEPGPGKTKVHLVGAGGNLPDKK